MNTTTPAVPGASPRLPSTEEIRLARVALSEAEFLEWLTNLLRAARP